MPKRNLIIIVLVVLLSLFCVMNISLRDRVIRYVAGKIADESLDNISTQSLYEGALTGMTEIISDHPYTSYLPFEEQCEYERELQGEVVGIGIFHLQKDIKSGEFSFIPVYGTPAFKSGLKLGDRIVAIDGKEVLDFSIWDVFDKLRGEEGSRVVLTIRPAKSRDSNSDKVLKEVEITRALFRQDIVYGDRRNKDGSWEYRLQHSPEIGYVAVTQFTNSTVGELRAALEQLREQDVEKVILDFRGNPGGFLPGAVEICNMFIPAGLDIVTTRVRSGGIKDRFVATNGPKLPFKLALLVDEESASASEIVAACLQDHKRAVVIGSRSYGKGTIQELFNLPCMMGELRLTNASFWRPSNVPLHRFPTSRPSDSWGVTPDQEYLVPLKGYQKAVSVVVRDLRRSLVPDEIEHATEAKIKEFETLLRELQETKSIRTRRELEAMLGLNNNSEKENDSSKRHESGEQGKSIPAGKKEPVNPSPAGKAPYYDPQLEKAIEFFEK